MTIIHEIYGAVLILLGIAMIWAARPQRGKDNAPFLRNWVVGQIYIMAAMISFVMGITLTISG